MEARLDRRTCVGKTVNMAHVGSLRGRSLLFQRPQAQTDRLSDKNSADRPRPVTGHKHIRTDIGRQKPEALIRHQPAGQLDGVLPPPPGIIVGACARRLGNAGEIGKQFCVFFKNIPFTLTACSARRPRSADLAK